MKNNLLFCIALFGLASFANAQSVKDTVKISKVPAGNEITIDGIDNEAVWKSVAWTRTGLSIMAANTADQAIDYVDDANYAAKFKTLWDDDYLYVITDIVDDVLVSKSDLLKIAVTDPWSCDNVEIFTHFNSPDVNETGGISDASQFRFFCDLDAATSDSITGGGWATGFSYSEYHAAGYTVRTTLKTGGYMVEARIPWYIVLPDGAPTNTLPVIGNSFKFDINPADCDVASADPSRSLILSWNSRQNNNWNNTSLYGIAVFGENAIISGIDDKGNSKLLIYPTIVTNTLNVNNLSGTSKIVVTNTAGQIVSQSVVTSNSTILNVESLKSGIYIINVNGNTSKFIKQ